MILIKADILCFSFDPYFFPALFLQVLNTLSDV